MAYEDFTTFTEVDPNSKWTVDSATKVSTNQLPTRDNSYIYKDYGAAYFGDFEHYFDFQVTTKSIDGLTPEVVIWGLSNEIGTYNNWTNYEYIRAKCSPSNFALRLVAGGAADETGTLSYATTYYAAISRTGTSLTLEVYSSSALRDSGGSGDVDSWSVTAATTTFRYLYAGTGESGSPDAGYITHFVENFLISVPQSVSLADTLTLSDAITLSLSKETVLLNDTLTLTDSIISGEQSQNCSRIIDIGSDILITITDTDPATVIKIDTSGAIPTFEVYELSASAETYKNAKDICFNDNFNRLYVACADGLIAKIDSTDLNSREEISVSDTDDLINIADSEEFYKTFVGTDNAVAELYEIDEATMSEINTDFRTRLPSEDTFNTFFTYIDSTKINTDFRYLATTRNQIKTDFRYLTDEYDDLEPAPRYGSGFTVKIDGVETTDVRLDTIQIRWIAEEKSTATFVLGRYHDKLNYTLDGTSSQITNKNNVVIYINDIEVFTGKIDTLDAANENEYVQVSCIGTIRNPNYISVNLPLPSVDEQLHPYQILEKGTSINIKKFVDDYDETDNPILYKGVKIDLGTEDKESVSSWLATGSMPALALKIEEGTWREDENWTYFWWATARLIDPFATNFTREINSKYIGTSLGSLSDDLWELTGARYNFQRIFDNVETALGYYYLGSAPYKEVSSKNGSYIAKTRWEDREDGFYVVKHRHWDYVDYAKAVAAMEYEKMKDSNDVAPNDANYTETNATVTLTIDAFLYYYLGLLTKINITNTTESDIYNSNNGFPLRIKTITIDSSTMKVAVSADNQKTEAELEALENEVYPTEPDIIEETTLRLYTKFDPNKYEVVE